jgi:hypothetical protein
VHDDRRGQAARAFAQVRQESARSCGARHNAADRRDPGAPPFIMVTSLGMLADRAPGLLTAPTSAAWVANG